MWKCCATAGYYNLIQDQVPNMEVHAKIQHGIGPHKDLTIVERCKHKWYRHVSRSSGLAQRAVENGEIWRKLVVKSSVVPQGPLQLRDRWGEVRSENWTTNYFFLSRRQFSYSKLKTMEIQKSRLCVQIFLKITGNLGGLAAVTTINSCTKCSSTQYHK